MAIKKDPKTGKFQEGNKPRGRPKGAKNKLRINDVLLDADKHSTKALELLIKIMDGQVKGASVSQQMQAAIKVLQLAYQNKEITDKDEKQAVEDLSPEKAEDDAPLISLKAVQ